MRTRELGIGIVSIVLMMSVSCQRGEKEEKVSNTPRVLAVGEVSPQTPEQDYMGTKRAAEQGDPVAQYQLDFI